MLGQKSWRRLGAVALRIPLQQGAGLRSLGAVRNGADRPCGPRHSAAGRRRRLSNQPRSAQLPRTSFRAAVGASAPWSRQCPRDRDRVVRSLLQWPRDPDALLPARHSTAGRSGARCSLLGRSRQHCPLRLPSVARASDVGRLWPLRDGRARDSAGPLESTRLQRKSKSF
jgi:hypothetical protein